MRKSNHKEKAIVLELLEQGVRQIDVAKRTGISIKIIHRLHNKHIKPLKQDKYVLAKMYRHLAELTVNSNTKPYEIRIVSKAIEKYEAHIYTKARIEL